MTNYEKIKAMSVDEMAGFMVKTIMENFPKRKGNKYARALQIYILSKHWKNWLESETEPNFCTDKQNKLIHCEDCHEDC